MYEKRLHTGFLYIFIFFIFSQNGLRYEILLQPHEQVRNANDANIAQGHNPRAEAESYIMSESFLVERRQPGRKVEEYALRDGDVVVVWWRFVRRGHE